MTRPRDRRRSGRGPYLLGLRRNPDEWRDGFPYEVPAVAAIEGLDLDRFGGEGMYILDEPEAALSVSGALALVGILEAPDRFLRAVLEDD